MPQLILKKLRGVNATQAEMLLDAGVPSNIQNIRNRPVDNWVKRNGIEPLTSQTSPIMGIFDIELDGLIIPVYQAGDTLYFFPNIESASFPNPDPFPPFDPLDPNGNFVLFLVEPLMRAVQEKRLRAAETKITWPSGNIFSSTTTNVFFAADGSLLNGNTGVAISTVQNVSDYFPTGTGTAQFPTNNLYAYDLAYMDTYLGQATGTRASQLVNVIRTEIINLLAEQKYYVEPLEAQNAITWHDETSIGLPAASTAANYRSTLTNMRNAFRLLQKIAIGDFKTAQTNTAYRPFLSTSSSLVSCDAAKALEIANWGAGAWTSSPTVQIGLRDETEFAGAAYFAELVSERGQLSTNVTSNYSSTGTQAYWYLKLAKRAAFDDIGISNSPVSKDGNYHQFEAATLQGTSTTSMMADEIPTFNSSCPVIEYRSGWIIDSAYISFLPTFINTF